MQRTSLSMSYWKKKKKNFERRFLREFRHGKAWWRGMNVATDLTAVLLRNSSSSKVLQFTHLDCVKPLAPVNITRTTTTKLDPVYIEFFQESRYFKLSSLYVSNVPLSCLFVQLLAFLEEVLASFDAWFLTLCYLLFDGISVLSACLGTFLFSSFILGHCFLLLTDHTEEKRNPLSQLVNWVLSMQQQCSFVENDLPHEKGVCIIISMSAPCPRCALCLLLCYVATHWTVFSKSILSRAACEEYQRKKNKTSVFILMMKQYKAHSMLFLIIYVKPPPPLPPPTHSTFEDGTTSEEANNSSSSSITFSLSYTIKPVNIDLLRITPPNLFSEPPDQISWMFDPGMVGKGVLTCCMTLRNGCIEFDPGMVGKGVLTCCMTLRNGCIEFDPGMVGKGVLTCRMTLRKLSK